MRVWPSWAYVHHDHVQCPKSTKAEVRSPGPAVTGSCEPHLRPLQEPSSLLTDEPLVCLS